MQFFKCEVCGKIICVIEESMAPTVCCGKPMTELRPGTTDAATEKHIPAYKIEGNTCYVTVGSVLCNTFRRNFYNYPRVHIRNEYR